MQNIELTQFKLSIMFPMGIVLQPVFTTSPTKKSNEKRLAVVKYNSPDVLKAKLFCFEFGNCKKFKYLVAANFNFCLIN